MSVRAAPIEVKEPVTATVGPVYLRLFPYSEAQTAVDEWDERPWAWGAMCRVKFRIGELTTSKRVSQRYAYMPKGWASRERPSDADLAAGRETVLDNLRIQLARHGFDPPEFDIHEVEVNDTPVTGGVDVF